ncbi:Thialysine N-epsilon-acetyltransferase [Pseudolycoriella hygida]|uniref:Thialysine N-epsilon-acetyltransferase n=1 Tax=Pseudolycoriella hygida TaxID=35572 RepID=A0A9Q0RXV6_9DIPT|nr:Thialysine N-epsilon-acetyltransferase [Pseudolycoriella hygida]
MLYELADFEKMPDGPKLTVEDLIRDGGFNSNDSTNKAQPLFFCFIAEEMSTTTNRNDDGNVDLILNRQPMTRKSVGYSICFFSSYSTWGGRTLYMEDLYELAKFEQMFSEPDVKVEDLYKDGGFSSDPAIFVCFIAEIITNDSERMPIGYAIVFNGYSTWQGRTLKLKDLYVRDGYRKSGAGRKIISAIASHAKEVNAARLYFHVLEWNTAARSFYESLGATNWTEMEEWALFRLDKNAIESLVQ